MIASVLIGLVEKMRMFLCGDRNRTRAAIPEISMQFKISEAIGIEFDRGGDRLLDVVVTGLRIGLLQVGKYRTFVGMVAIVLEFRGLLLRRHGPKGANFVRRRPALERIEPAFLPPQGKGSVVERQFCRFRNDLRDTIASWLIRYMPGLSVVQACRFDRWRLDRAQYSALAMLLVDLAWIGSAARRESASGNLESAMRFRGWIAAAALICSAAPLAIAQSVMGVPSNEEQYVPQLADIMSTAQSRHIKLWLAGKAANWELAAFELDRLKVSLVEAAVLYSGIPVSNVTTLANPLGDVAGAIEAKDARGFAKAYGELTAACNGCHQSLGRPFLVIRVPTEQPFGDQVFSSSRK